MTGHFHSICNISPQILSALGLSAGDAGFRGCIRRFRLGLREIKVQSSSEPMVTQRSGLAECGTSPCEGVPCRNGGKCHAAPDGTYFSCRCGFFFFCLLYAFVSIYKKLNE